MNISFLGKFLGIAGLLLDVCVFVSSSGMLKGTKWSAGVAEECGTLCGVGTYLPKDSRAIFLSHLEKDKLDAVFFNISIHNRHTVTNATVELLQRWVWANSRGRFILSLPYDFDIRSAGTLMHKVKHQSIAVTPYPRDCYKTLNETCKVDFIARFLAEKVTGFRHPNEDTNHSQICRWAVKCGATVGAEDTLYRCCHFQNTFTCDDTVQPNIWIQFARYTLLSLAIVFGIFCPFLLPFFSQRYQTFGSGKLRKSRGLRRLREGRSTDSSTSLYGIGLVNFMSYDDDPPVSLGYLFCFDNRSTGWGSRIARFILLLVIVPILLYLQTFVYLYYKQKDIELRNDLGISDVTSVFIAPNIYISVSLFLFSVLLACVMVALPKSLADLERRLTYRRDEKYFLFFKKPETVIRRASEKQGFVSLCQTMAHHFALLTDCAFWRFFGNVLIHPVTRLIRACRPASPEAADKHLNGISEAQDSGDYEDNEEDVLLCVRCVTMSLLILFVFMLPVWMIFVVISLIIYVTPLTYVAIRIWRALFEFRVHWDCCEAIPICIRMCSLPILYILFLVFCVCVVVSYFVVVGVIIVSLIFLCNVIGFTLIGFILYVDFYSSCLILAFWGLFYLYKYYTDYKTRYRKFKELLFDVCQKVNMESQGAQNTSPSTPSTQNSQDSSSISSSLGSRSLMHSDVDNVPCIPLCLFVITAKQVLPVSVSFLGMVLKLVSTGVYLAVMFFFLCSINEQFDPAHGTLAQGVALFLVCAVPLVLGKLQSEEYMERNRFAVQKVVRQFKTDMNNGRIDFE